MQLRTTTMSIGENLGLRALALVLGLSAGVFVNGYWLVDLFPSGSSQLLLFTALSAIAAAAAYIPLLKAARRNLGVISPSQRVSAVVLSMVLAGFFFFTGTRAWKATGRYITFLLPQHELHLSAVSAPKGTALIWFNTSLGEVSYDNLDAQGWTRRGDAMVLESASDNSLYWTGQTGADVQLVFRNSQSDVEMRLVWDDHDELITLDAPKSVYGRSFPVPFYASRTLIVLLGFSNFLVIVLGLVGLSIKHRAAWLPVLGRASKASGGRLDRRELLIMAAGVCLALLLRSFYLAAVFPAVDEYYHLIAAQQILDGAPLGSVYPRGRGVVTLPVALALRVFGHEVWAARLMGVLFNAMAVVPLYLLSRKINRPIAALACVLYVASPWIITFARVAREYAYYPFYFYWILLAMLELIEAIPKGYVLVRDWRAALRPKIGLLAVLLVLPPIFALKVDWLSTFRTILIAYLVFGIFLLARFDWTDRRNWPFLGGLMAVLILVGRDWYREQITKLLLVPRLNPIPVQYFFPNPPQQWYFDRLGIVVALGLVTAIAAALLQRRSNFIPLFMVSVFASYLAVFALISRSFFHTRHLISTQFWFVVVVAMGLYWLWQTAIAVTDWKSTAGTVVLGIVIGLAVMNVGQVALPSLSKDPDMPISEDYLHDMSEVQAYLVDHVRDDDVLISTVYGLYAAWEAKPSFSASFRITSQTPKEEIAGIVEKHAAGWIVMDQIRVDLSPLSVRDITNIEKIEYIGLFGDEHVWRWSSSMARVNAAVPPN